MNRSIRRLLVFHLVCSTAYLAFAAGPAATAQPAQVTVVASAAVIDGYDFVELTINVPRPTVANPFTDAVVTGEFRSEGSEPGTVDGFCDTQDGSVFRVRFLATKLGLHRYSVTYRQGAVTANHAGKFTARPAGRRGLVRIDREHPWHFVWGGNRKPPARSADNRRRLAWTMVMADGYQTTGERADTGTGWGPDAGGGWINGRGDDSVVMLQDVDGESSCDATKEKGSHE